MAHSPKFALYRETLQATGRTTRIVIAPGEFAPILSIANSVASARHPARKRASLRATSTYHGQFSRLWKTGTFYFAGKRNFLLCLDIADANGGTA